MRFYFKFLYKEESASNFKSTTMRTPVCLVVPLLITGLFAAPAFDDDSNEEVILEEDDFDDELYGSLTGRIVGGAAASPGAFPYQVSLRKNERHFCGGSILNTEWIITAAHCLIGVGNTAVTVVAGTNQLFRGGIRRRSIQVIPYPEYYEAVNDIGLIKLGEPLVYSDLVKPIALPLKNIKAANYPAVISGWGTSSRHGKLQNDLQFLKTQIMDHEECQNFFNSVTDQDICTYSREGQGACFGDSGGPLVTDGALIGVVSRGKACAVGYPDVYTRVYSYLDWIKQHIN